MLRKHIYFDGFLPEAKASVRLERLGKSLDQLRKFRILHPEVCPQQSERRHATGTDWLQSRELRALPAPPFLVPTILEALLASKYGSMTEVVPCEADAKCSNPAISTHEDYILTGDSDLLIHHAPGRILMFADLMSREQMSKKNSLFISCYDSNAIAKRFELPNLLLVAYFIKQDPHLSYLECVKKAKGSAIEEDSQYANFRLEYEINSIVISSGGQDQVSDATCQTVCSRLDPRVSELVQNWIQSRLNAKQRLVSTGLMEVMYLPFLIDDPTRASAWRESTYIRSVAYSTLFLNRAVQLTEVDRRGLRIAEISVTLLTPLELESTMQELNSSIHRMREVLGQVSEVSYWRTFALLSVLRVLKDEVKAFPSKERVDRVFFGKLGQQTWSQVHLAAQVEAYLYSLRLLAQVLMVTLTPGLAPVIERAQIPATLGMLLKSLETLPMLAQLLTTPGGRLPLTVDEEMLAMEFSSFFPAKQKPERDGMVGEGGRARKKRKKPQSSSKQFDRGNMFSILGDA